jgi:ATP adenylyltransferase
MSYIQREKEEECIFCVAQEKPDGLGNLIVQRSQNAFVILNRYPYTSGHLMVVPFLHHHELEDLDPKTRAEMMELTTQCVRAIKLAYGAQGFNIGVNLGSAAGAGIPQHVHFHVVPRWEGDTNFMSSVGGTRVVPEALEDTYQRVKEAWKSTFDD